MATNYEEEQVNSLEYKWNILDSNLELTRIIRGLHVDNEMKNQFWIATLNNEGNTSTWCEIQSIAKEKFINNDAKDLANRDRLVNNYSTLYD